MYACELHIKKNQQELAFVKQLVVEVVWYILTVLKCSY